MLDLAQNARSLWKRGEAEGQELLRLVMPGSTLEGDMVKPVFRSPFDIIHRLASEARAIDNAQEGRWGAALTEAERLVLLPGPESNSPIRQYTESDI